MKYSKEFLEYFEKFPAFTVRDVKLFLKKRGAGPTYYKTLMHNTMKSNQVLAIARGRYTLHDNPMVAGFTFSPFYYGMETALTYHKLWDYMTPISIITTNRVRKGSIELLGRNATIRRIEKDKFFGYSNVEYDGVYMPMADMEKTAIDSVYFHSRFSREVYAAMARRLDRKRLELYLESYTEIVRKQINILIG